MSKFLYNGKFHDISQPVLTATNRAFTYGDAVFETMKVIHGRILFVEDHLERLAKASTLLRLELNEKLNTEFLEGLASSLFDANRINGAARLRLEVFREEGGFYITNNINASYIATLEPLVEIPFVLNERGLQIDVFTDIHKTKDVLASLKTTNKLPFVLGGFFMLDKKLDECLIINSDGFIAESVNANVFFVKDGNFYTPSISEACIDGIMRKNVTRILRKHDKKLFECIVRVEELLSADEIFLTNTISGIRWVGAFRNKRYFNHSSRWLTAELNQAVKAFENSILFG